MESVGIGSKETSRAALRAAMSQSRAEEADIKKMYAENGIHTAAVDFGGEFSDALIKVIERTIVAAKREGVISSSHAEEGAVAGATRDALTQLTNKALGLSIGGKIGVARHNDHISVAVFFEIGLLHLNEVAVGLGHRVI